MPRLFDRLDIPLCWTLGLFILICQTLSLVVIGGASYALVAAVGWLLGVDLLGAEHYLFFLISAVVWAPAATGYALSVVLNRLMAARLNEPQRSPGKGTRASMAAILRRKEASGDLSGKLAVTMVTGGILAANLAPIVLLIEFMEWLTKREWPGFTLADGLALFGILRAAPESDAERLTDLILAVPLSISLFAVGLLLCMAGLNLADRSVRPVRGGGDA